MKLLKVLALSLVLLFAGCAESPDFWVGPTPVYLEEGALEQIPCDFVSVLRETERELENRFDKKLAIKIMGTPVRLYPDYATPISVRDRAGYFNGLKEGGDLHVRILGPSILTSALLHEQIAHCVCLEKYKDINVYHDNKECNLQETEISAIVREKTQKERDGRCSEQSWR